MKDNDTNSKAFGWEMDDIAGAEASPKSFETSDESVPVEENDRQTMMQTPAEDSNEMYQVPARKRRRRQLIVIAAVLSALVLIGVVVLVVKSTNDSQTSSVSGSSREATNSNQKAGVPTVGRFPPIASTSAPISQTAVPSSQPSGMPTTQPSTVPSEHASSFPSLIPTPLPSEVHSDPPSLLPTWSFSAIPSMQPTSIPSFIASFDPSAIASSQPTLLPSTATSVPTAVASLSPTVKATKGPTTKPSSPPTTKPVLQTSPSMAPTPASHITTFYGIGDVPYNPGQAAKLIEQMTAIPNDAEFVIHVGDMRHEANNTNCTLAEYSDVAYRFGYSPVPVFVILGDNDWTDCPNMDQAFGFWMQEFYEFETRFWAPKFDVKHHPNRTENYYFVHKGTLFFGLNMVGAPVVRPEEWYPRLTDLAGWTMDTIRLYYNSSTITRVVIFGHANPSNIHDDYFKPVAAFIQNELQNQLPILYFNGDKHQWQYEPDFYGESSWLRIMVKGGTSEPPVQVVIDSQSNTIDPQQAFVYDRFWDGSNY